MATNIKCTNSLKYNKALTLEDRITALKMIISNRDSNGCLEITLNDLAASMEKDPTTISKEIKKNATVTKEASKFSPYNKELYCEHCDKSKKCPIKDAYLEGLKNITYNEQEVCPEFERVICPNLKHFPWVCNGCPKLNWCRLEHRKYDPEKAHKKYLYTLSDSREGLTMFQEEFDKYDEIISGGIMKGQSLEIIYENNKELLPFSLRTIYNYMHLGYFSAKPIDNRRMPKMKPRRKKSSNSVVVRRAKIGHTYSDYTNYISENEDSIVCQMDTVIGLREASKVILTLHIPLIHFQFYFILPDKTAESVVTLLDNLVEILGIDDYKKVFGLILTDNGAEFSDVDGIRFYNLTGEERSLLYFCEPLASFQKGACEKNHELFRYIYPKSTSFDNVTQDDLNLVMSHINSYKRKSTDYSTPIELFRAHFGSEILSKLNIKEIPANDIILTPALVK